MRLKKFLAVFVLLFAAQRGAVAFQPSQLVRISLSTVSVSSRPSIHEQFKRQDRHLSTISQRRKPHNTHGAITRTSLQAVPNPFLALATSPLGGLFILASIVLIHEAGHYLAARTFGIEVEEFAVGFGPKVFGFTALGNEFNVRLFPLGGYVRFPENYNATEAEELQKEAYEAAVAKRNREANPTIGYKIANALSFGSLAKQDRRLQEKRVEEELLAFEKMNLWEKIRARQEKRKEDEELEVEEIEIPYSDNPNLLQNRPWFQRAVVISGGVLFNLLLSFFIYFGEISGPRGLPSPVFDAGVKVGSIPQQTAAARGLLQPGDIILQANGVPLTRSSSPSVGEAQKAMNDLIALIRSTPDGGKVELAVMRQQGDFMETVFIQPKRSAASGGDVTSGPQSIGVLLTPNYVKKQILRSDDPVKAAQLAFQYTSTLTTETANGLGTLLKGVFVGGSGGSGSSVSGPIGLIRTGSEVVATRDLSTVLLFAAAISINLGVVNAFPLPALDGGQLVFVLAEAVMRRKIDQRIQEGITGFTVVILLLVSVSAALGDISSIFGGR